MDTRKIPVFCFWNGCIKNGPDGPFYEGSSPRVIRVDRKMELSQLLEDLYRVTGFEKGKFQSDLIGRYPSIVQQQTVKYVRPRGSNLPSLYHQSPLEDNANRKRSRQEEEASVNADVNVTVRNTKLRSLPEDNHNGWIEDEESTDVPEDNHNGWIEDEKSTDAENCCDNGVAQKDPKLKKPTLTKDVSERCKCHKKNTASQPSTSIPPCSRPPSPPMSVPPPPAASSSAATGLSRPLWAKLEGKRICSNRFWDDCVRKEFEKEEYINRPALDDWDEYDTLFYNAWLGVELKPTR